jgi:hypothetical protein
MSSSQPSAPASRFPATRSLPDDTIEYRIYLDSIHSDFDSNSDDLNAQIQSLEALRTACMQHLHHVLHGFIWHREPFQLRVSVPPALPTQSVDDFEDANTADDNENPLQPKARRIKYRAAHCAHLFGRTCVGDNIEDEWFIVYCLLELTKFRNDISISARDSDGQFLLIETAESIPSWLAEDNARYRVWLRQGHMHIIPIPRTPAELMNIPSKLTPENALTFLRSPIAAAYTVAAAPIQQQLRSRLESHPIDTLAHNRLWRRCILPYSVALAIRRSPALISRAIETFYLRDPVCLRDAASLRRFKPALKYELPKPAAKPTSLISEIESKPPAVMYAPSDSQEMVACRIRFSRALYAMLTNQPYHAPKRYPMPPSDSNAELVSAAELGMKLTCAMEMLYQDAVRKRAVSRAENDATSVGSALDQDIARLCTNSNPHWVRYRDSLKQMGWFGDYIEGSAPYRVALRNAQVGYCKQNSKSDNRSDVDHNEQEWQTLQNSEAPQPDAAMLIDTILAPTETQACTYLAGFGYEHELICPTDLILETLACSDSDDFMHLTPEQLDQLLSYVFFSLFLNISFQSKFTYFCGLRQSDRSTAPASDPSTESLDSMLQGLKKFGAVQSDFRGAAVSDKTPASSSAAPAFSSQPAKHNQSDSEEELGESDEDDDELGLDVREMLKVLRADMDSMGSDASSMLQSMSGALPPAVQELLRRAQQLGSLIFI